MSCGTILWCSFGFSGKKLLFFSTICGQIRFSIYIQRGHVSFKIGDDMKLGRRLNRIYTLLNVEIVTNFCHNPKHGFFPATRDKWVSMNIMIRFCFLSLCWPTIVYLAYAPYMYTPYRPGGMMTNMWAPCVSEPYETCVTAAAVSKYPKTVELKQLYLFVTFFFLFCHP